MSEVKIPELAESITEGTISEWLVNVGDTIAKGDPVVELETDKVNVEVNSEVAGVITEIVRGVDEDVEVGDVIAHVSDSGETPAPTEKPEATEEKAEETKSPAEEPVAEEAPAAASEGGKDVIASPAARKRARELNIDLSQVQAHDPLGRIRPEDVEAAAQASKQPAAPAKKESAPVEQVNPAKPEKREKMSRRRQTIAKRLVEAQQTAAMLTTFNEVDMSAVMNLRKERQEQFVAKNDIKLGFMSFFAKASVAALKEFPHLNAEIDGTDLLLKEYYDIGIAVGVPGGLVVPVIRDVDELDFAEIEKEVKDLGGKAQNNSLSLDELQGGSFTRTNGGIFG